MITYTYTTLVAAIQAYAEENDPDFIANIDDFIGKGELRLIRDLDLELFEQFVGVSISGGNREVTRPTDSIEINELMVRSPSIQIWDSVPRRSFEYCLMAYPDEAVVGVPKFFAELSETKIYVTPTPDQTYATANAKVRCTIRPTGLNSGNENSWLGDHYADALFSTVMIEAYDFLKHPSKLQEAATKYQSLLPSLLKEVANVQRPEYRELNSGNKGADD